VITLLTGAPGAGKTAQLVEWLRTLYKDRPIYSHGLNGLKLAHQPIDASRWHVDLPDGAILVVDEAQDVWRPRGPGHAAPESIKAMETHRHRGVDIFLTTQKPGLIDKNIRELVGRHVHIRDTGWLGRWAYEWPECSENIAWKTCALKRRYNPPKAAFAFYRSASEHTTVQKGRSLMPFITVGLLLLTVALIFGVYRAISSKTEPKAAPVGAAASAASPATDAARAPARPSEKVSPGATSAAGIVAAFKPRIAERPETAPAYDELRKVVVMPRVTGGYCVGGKCKCLHQQGFDAGITDEACRQWMRLPPFDPYRAEPSPQRAAYTGQQGANDGRARPTPVVEPAASL
jgi:zona occludens toxin